MRERRLLNAIRVETYNDVARCVNNGDLAIFVVGEAYEELKLKALNEKKVVKACKKIGGAGLLTASLFIPGGIIGIPTILAMWGGGAYLLKSKKDDFKNYKISINLKEERVELIRIKGDGDTVDFKYDTII